MKNILASLAYCLATMALGQNLVPNPSFEEYTECPWNFGQWADVVGWTSPYTTSADYYNLCAAGGAAGVPLNTCGYQYPADGEAYMGVATYVYNAPPYRELIATQLASPLQPGLPVYLSFKVALGGFGSSQQNSGNYTCKGIGMKFFTQMPSDWPNYLYPNTSAVHLQQAITDTSAWVTVSGVYTPDSAYTQLVIGNFYADSLSDPFIFDTAGYGVANIAYHFLDQVCVSYDPYYCSDWEGVAPHQDEKLVIGPNPFTDQLQLQGTSALRGNRSLELIDALGRTVHRSQWPEGQQRCTLATSELHAGYYILSINNTEGGRSAYPLIHISP